MIFSSVIPSRMTSSTPFIDTLPTELVLFILLIVAEHLPEEATKKSRALTELGLTCRRWYHLIFSEPQFWVRCSVSNNRTKRALTSPIATLKRFSPAQQVAL